MPDDPAGSPEQWLDRHGAALYRYALTHLRDPHLAEEAVQETLLAALRSRDRFAGGSSPRTWLIGILKHKIIDQFRRSAREVTLDDPERFEAEDLAAADDCFAADGHWETPPSDWGDPVKALEGTQFWTLLQRCLDALPERLARLFLLREVMEEDTEHICQELAITPTNLWTMLYRARLRLRDCLDGQWSGALRG
jgi:RNA polymerase sigma-70 factor (ECF subfamily)